MGVIREFGDSSDLWSLDPASLHGDTEGRFLLEVRMRYSFFSPRESKVYIRTENRRKEGGENYKSSFKSEKIKRQNVALVIVHIIL